MKKILIIANWENRAPDIEQSLLQINKNLNISTYNAFRRETPPKIANYDAFIISGGPMGVYQINEPRYDFVLSVVELTKEIIASEKTLLGICFGHQLIAKIMGGTVIRDEAREEIGWTKLKVIEKNSRLLTGIPDEFEAFEYHTDRVAIAPKGAKILMKSDQVDIEALEYPGRPIFSIQFHPEYSGKIGNEIYTSEGHQESAKPTPKKWNQNRQQILKNFLKIIPKS
jgi:GMP synthase (glutamine-hydrolysing)